MNILSLVASGTVGSASEHKRRSFCLSDTRLVESGKCRGATSIKALSDTDGMTTPARARYWLTEIARAVHRGPGRDTWTSAREEAANRAGITISMAARIWHRWGSMKFVDGDAVLKLMLAYERLCENNERAAAEYRSLRLGVVERSDAKTDQEPRQSGRGMDSPAGAGSI